MTEQDMEKEYQQGQKKIKRKKVVSQLLSFSKFLVFITFVYTAFVMYTLGDLISAGIIIAVLLFFLILNRLDV